MAATLDQIASNQASKEVTVNANFVAVSAAGVYGYKASGSSGLAWAYYGGPVKTNGGEVLNGGGTLTLTASSTNYVVAAKSNGAVSVSTSNTNWNDGTNYKRLWLITTGTTGPTDAVDYRALFDIT